MEKVILIGRQENADIYIYIYIIVNNKDLIEDHLFKIIFL